MEIQDDWALVSGGNDTRLYHIGGTFAKLSASGADDGKGTNDQEQVRLAYIYNEMPYNRCIEWHPTLKGIVSLWYAGKIIIGQFRDLDAERSPLNAPSFRVLGEVSRNSRSCNIISFCPFQQNILMVGFDKARNDSGLIFYNVENILERRNLPMGDNDEEYTDSSPPTVVSQYGSSQGVHSACWLAKPSNLFVVGMGFKWIRAYNLLDPTAGPVLTISTKSVLGLTADPFNASRFASFSEDGFIRIWDSAVSLSEPLLVINTDLRQHLLDISFSPSRSGLFCAYGKDSATIRVWQLDQLSLSLPVASNGQKDDLTSTPPSGRTGTGMDYEEQIDITTGGSGSQIRIGSLSISRTRTVKPKSNANINSVKWLDRLQPTLLVCMGKDYKVILYPIPSAPVFAWSSSGLLSVAGSDSRIQEFSAKGSQMMSLQDEQRRPQIEDIAKTIYDRANQNYGLDCKLNREIVTNDEHLCNAWQFLDCVTSSSTSAFEIDEKDYISLGLGSVVKNMPASQARSLGADLGFPLISYSSGYRDVGLSLCGWEHKDSFHETIQRLEYKGEFEKAAGLLFLYLGDLGKTIECLNGSGDERLILIAAALAGGLGSKSTLWKNLCKNLSYQLRDPFLRLLFGLISFEGNWSLVLNETSLSLRERMIIAFKFLDDTTLMSYVGKWTETVERHGRIDGILLTGLNWQGIDLLERYVDRTGDCQSPALIVSLISFSHVDQRIETWIECYRDLLDSYQLYKVRAKFDILRRKEGHSHDSLVPFPQVYVKCNFCNQPVSYGSRPKKSTPISSSSRQKATNCPNCFASLPRCSICMLHLGSQFDSFAISNQSLHSLLQKPSADLLNNRSAVAGSMHQNAPSSTFDSWFTWCQSCHHGGHAAHIYEWFSRNKTCPVTSCLCKCQASPNLE